MACCTFLGHRDCDIGVQGRLYQVIENLITENNVDTFFVGTHGNFDRLVYTVLCRLQKIYSIEIVVVLAYLNRKSEAEKYKNTVFPAELEITPKRFAIKKRNQYMIDHSQYLVCYLQHSCSAVYTQIKIAAKKGVRVINLGIYPL